MLAAVWGLLFAAMLSERGRRRRAQRLLDERLRFERLLADLRATFGRLHPRDVGPQIEAALGKTLDLVGVDRVALTEMSADGRLVLFTYRRGRSGIPTPPATTADSYPWSIERLRRGDSVVFVRLDDLPADAAIDRASFLAVGTRSLAAVPLVVGDAVVGALRFATTTREREWPADFVAQLHVLAEIFGNALARRQADAALRETEERFRALADETPVSMWATNARGQLTFLNAEALRFTGRPLDRALGNGWAELLHPADRAACLAAYRNAAGAGRK